MNPRFPIEDDALTAAVVQALDRLRDEVRPDNTLLARQGLPRVVHQALADRQLSPVARLAMWYLVDWLDFVEYREVKASALATEMGTKDRTAVWVLQQLADRGYLDAHARRRPRAFRLPQSRRKSERAAA